MFDPPESGNHPLFYAPSQYSQLNEATSFMIASFFLEAGGGNCIFMESNIHTLRNVCFFVPSKPLKRPFTAGAAVERYLCLT